MSTIDEKRVYGDRAGATDAYVASSVGVVRVRVNDDAVGEFGLVERGDARDVAASRPSSGRAGRGPEEAARHASPDDEAARRPSPDDEPPALAVATATDVLVGLSNGTGSAGAGSAGAEADGTPVAFEETGFGPAVAVGFDAGTLLAADPDGGLARRDGASWQRIDPDDPLSVRAIDGALVGTDRGVYRLGDGDLSHVGLSDVRDVSAAGVPLAATGDGLYALGNGWMRAVEGAVDAVAADPLSESGSLDRAHAAAGTTLLSHDDGAWEGVAEAADAITGIAHGTTAYAVTANGTFLAIGADGLRSRSLGVPDVAAVAIPNR